jgi:transcriptional regulator with XRE-family HTH domain
MSWGAARLIWKVEMTDSLNNKEIGTAARTARGALGLTQEEAAEQIGITVEFYSRIERGRARPGLNTLVHMALVFQVSTDKLLGLAADERAQRILEEFASKRPKDPPELSRLFRKLRRAAANKVRFVSRMLAELDKIYDEPYDESYDGDDDDV